MSLRVGGLAHRPYDMPMRSSLVKYLVGFIALAILIGVGFREWKDSQAKELIPWRKDLAAAASEARESHRRVFAYFTASWCGPCQEMKTTTWADTHVQKAIERFVPVKIDVDAHNDQAQQFGVDAMPTFIILADTGKVEKMKVGFTGPEEMVRWLEP